MTCPWKFTLYKSWSEVDSLQFIAQWKLWMSLDPAAHVFFHPDIVKPWVDSYRYHFQIEPLYFVAELDGIVFFLPMVVWKRNWKNAFVRTIIPVGYPDYDYHDPVITASVSTEVIDSFWKLMREQILKDSKIKFDEAIICGIRYPFGQDGWKEDDDICPYNDLTRHNDYQSFFINLKKGLKQDIQRQKRRLSEAGKLHYRVYGSGESAEAIAAFPAFLDAHCRRWPDSFKREGFYEKLIHAGLDEGLVHFSELQINDQPVCWHLGFTYKRRFYYYMPAFLEEFAVYSPSKIHLALLFEDAYNKGIQVFDFLRGNESYKKEWTHANTALYCYPFQRADVVSSMKLFAKNIMMAVRKKFFLATLPCFSAEVCNEMFMLVPAFLGV